jgi:DNA-binding LacI/PurR family transcriptional regulator
MQRKNINIKDVAKVAGCSQVTVARVFSGQIKVADKTKKKVLAAAKELNYTPNLLAQSLRNGTSNMIALVFSLSGPHDPEKVPQAISKFFWDKEKKISFISNPVRELLREQLLNYQQMRFAGIIAELKGELLLSHLDILRQFKGAVIVTPEKCDIEFDQIVWDRVPAVKDAVDYLIKTGRKSPGLILDPVVNGTKFTAFNEQLEKYKIDSAGRCINAIPGTEKGIDNYYEALTQRYPDGKQPYDALLCMNDEVAKMTIYWLNKNGYRVPEDVAVIGFNNSQTAVYTFPPLASVERHHGEISKIAYELLSSRLQDPGIPPRCVNLPMTFVRRESAG